MPIKSDKNYTESLVFFGMGLETYNQYNSPQNIYYDHNDNFKRSLGKAAYQKARQ